MRDFHPDVKMALDVTRELRNRIADARDKVERIVARRPSPSGYIIPEVDAFGRLRDLYLAPGTCVRFASDELGMEIMAAVVESAEDARRQYRIVTNDRETFPRPLADVMRERWADSHRGEKPPAVGTEKNGVDG